MVLSANDSEMRVEGSVRAETLKTLTDPEGGVCRTQSGRNVAWGW